MMESNWFGSKMLWRVARCAPYFHCAIFPPLSIFNSCVNPVQSGFFFVGTLRRNTTSTNLECHILTHCWFLTVVTLFYYLPTYSSYVPYRTLCRRTVGRNTSCGNLFPEKREK
jgi:hypothetical protein